MCAQSHAAINKPAEVIGNAKVRCRVLFTSNRREVSWVSNNIKYIKQYHEYQTTQGHFPRLSCLGPSKAIGHHVIHQLSEIHSYLTHMSSCSLPSLILLLVSNVTQKKKADTLCLYCFCAMNCVFVLTGHTVLHGYFQICITIPTTSQTSDMPVTWKVLSQSFYICCVIRRSTTWGKCTHLHLPGSHMEGQRSELTWPRLLR